MIRQPTEDDLKERNEIWGYVSYWMKKLGISPMQLAQRTGLSQDSIKKGISGVPTPVMYKLSEIVDAFGLVSARLKSFEETSDVLSSGQLKECLQPPAMPPHQGNFWDD